MAERGYRALIEMPAYQCNCGGLSMLQRLWRWGMSRLSTIYQYCASDGVPRRSMVVALIVGTILNLINQGDVLFSGSDVNLAKLILTFAVPYCVATYGAVSYHLNAAQVADDAHSGTEVR